MRHALLKIIIDCKLLGGGGGGGVEFHSYNPCFSAFSSTINIYKGLLYTTFIGAIDCLYMFYLVIGQTDTASTGKY